MGFSVSTLTLQTQPRIMLKCQISIFFRDGIFFRDFFCKLKSEMGRGGGGLLFEMSFFSSSFRGFTVCRLSSCPFVSGSPK